MILVGFCVVVLITFDFDIDLHKDCFTYNSVNKGNNNTTRSSTFFRKDYSAHNSTNEDNGKKNISLTTSRNSTSLKVSTEALV